MNASPLCKSSATPRDPIFFGVARYADTLASSGANNPLEAVGILHNAIVDHVLDRVAAYRLAHGERPSKDKFIEILKETAACREHWYQDCVCVTGKGCSCDRINDLLKRLLPESIPNQVWDMIRGGVGEHPDRIYNTVLQETLQCAEYEKVVQHTTKLNYALKESVHPDCEGRLHRSLLCIEKGIPELELPSGLTEVLYAQVAVARHSLFFALSRGMNEAQSIGIVDADAKGAGAGAVVGGGIGSAAGGVGAGPGAALGGLFAAAGFSSFAIGWNIGEALS